MDIVQCVEKSVVCVKGGFEFAGTVDCIAEYNGECCITDYKTSSRDFVADELLFTHFAQLAAYRHAYNQINPTDLINKIIVIHVSTYTLKVEMK